MKRYKNPYFYIGLFGVLLAATGQDLNTLTTWSAVGDLIINTFMNPATLVGVFLAGLGVFVNPTTKGVKD